MRVQGAPLFQALQVNRAAGGLVAAGRALRRALRRGSEAGRRESCKDGCILCRQKSMAEQRSNIHNTVVRRRSNDASEYGSCTGGWNSGQGPRSNRDDPERGQYTQGWQPVLSATGALTKGPSTLF